MKYCRLCESSKPEKEFYRNKSQVDGRDVYCKPCRRSINQSFVDRNPDYHKDYYYRVTKPKRQAAAAARRAQKSQGAGSTEG